MLRLGGSVLSGRMSGSTVGILLVALQGKMLFHCPRRSSNLHLQLRIKTQDVWLAVADVTSQREHMHNADIRAAGSFTGHEVFAVQADAEGRRSFQRSRTRKDLMTINHPSCRLRVLQESKSTLAIVQGLDFSSDRRVSTQSCVEHPFESGRVWTCSSSTNQAAWSDQRPPLPCENGCVFGCVHTCLFSQANLSQRR